ncbi:MAG: hypothetical protein H6732_08080 [Alphaproteobacteria bacterium]|nr:hypothetical protein [Alphaproteobacteria bacterium]
MRRLAAAFLLAALGCAPGATDDKADDTDSGVTDSRDSGDTEDTRDSADSTDPGTGDTTDTSTGDSGDSGPADSGDSGDSGTADSGDSGTGDSGDSGDSGNSGDSGDSGDSGPGDSGDSAAGDSGDSGPPPTAVCVTNLDEPNNVRRQATDTLAFQAGNTFQTVRHLDGAQRDHDVYRADLPASCTVKVTVTPTNPVYALSVDLRTSVGQATLSRGVAGAVTTSWFNDTAGYSTVLVDIYASTAVGLCLEYTLDLQIDCTAPDPGADLPDDSCFEVDPLEPNDRQGLPTPTGLDQDGDRYRATRIFLDSLQGDLDRYRVDIPPGCFVDASISFDNSQGNLDLAVVYGILWSEGVLEAALVPSAVGTNDTERVLYRNGGSSPLSTEVVVFPGATGQACNAYDIDIRLTCSVTPPSSAVTYCTTVDPTEWTGLVAIPPPPTGRLLVVGRPTGLDLGGDTYVRTGIPVDSAFLDQDVFTGLVPPGCTLSATIDFDATKGDLDVLARGFDGTDVFLTQTTNSGESFTYTRPAGQDPMPFYLVIDPADGVSTCNTFDLNLGLTCPVVTPP